MSHQDLFSPLRRGVESEERTEQAVCYEAGG